MGISGQISLYKEYFRLGQNAYREKVRFVEDIQQDLRFIPFDERIEIELDYLLCLFELGRYGRFVQMSDPVIETIIRENIYSFQGQDIYQELLFRKAACLFQLRKLHDSRAILQQLVKMSSGNPLYLGLYLLCQRQLSGELQQFMKAVAVAALLLVVSITVIQLLLIEPLMEPYLQPFTAVRTALLAGALSILAWLELSIHTRIYRETGFFTYTLLNRIFNNSVKRQ